MKGKQENSIFIRVSQLAKAEKGWSCNKLGIELGVGNNIYRSLQRDYISAEFLFEICEILNLTAADAIDLYLIAGFFPLSPSNPTFAAFCNVYLSHRFSN